MSLRARGGGYANEGPTQAAWGEGNRLPLATLDRSDQDTTLLSPALSAPAQVPTAWGRGKAEPPESGARSRLYLRGRLERLQPELLPPPALRPEWDEAPSGLLPFTTSPFPCRGPVAPLPRVPGAAAALPPRPLRLLPLPLRGSLWRPPSSSRL